MATSYSHKSWGHTVGYWWYEVSETNINTSNNTSKITVNFYVKAAHGNQRSDTYNNYPAGYGSSTPYSEIYINGTKVGGKTPACFDIRYNSSKKIANGTSYHLGSASMTVTHNSSGGGSVSVKCRHYTSVSPNWVTLESSHSLTTISKPAPPPPPPPPPAPTHVLVFESLQSVQELKVGNSLVFKWEALTSTGIQHLKYTVTGAFSFSGTANNALGSGGNIPVGVIPKGGTVTLTVTLTDYNGQSVTKSITLTIKDEYKLYFNSLSINASKTYEEKGKHIAGKTAMFVDYSVTSTYDIKRVEFKMSGANSNYGGWDWPGKANTWNSGICYGLGDTWITCTVTDTAGHVASHQIYCKLWEEEHILDITSFEQTNGKIYILKQHTIGNSRFKFVVKWNNTHAITSIKFNVTGANPMSHSKSNPSGNSYTWQTENVTKVGNNTCTFTITDSKGATKTATISVQTSEEPYSINADSSYVDSNLCVNLVKGLAYMDYSRLGVRIKISHTHALKTIKVTINGRENSLSNFDPYASEFTFIDSQKIEKTGNITIKFYAKDANGREDSHTITYPVYKIIDPPVKPTISFETNTTKVFLSEGEKLTFKGESTDIKDYQVIYVLSSCDVISATSFCNNINGSYVSANQGQLTTNLKNTASGSLRYHILKDFGVDHNKSIITQDSSDKKKYHIHPLNPNHDDNFYALQFLNNAKPGDMIYMYVRERKMGTFDAWLYSDNYNYNNIPKSQLFTMCVLPPEPCQLNIYRQEQTSDKIVIKYANPIYDMNVSNSVINLIDVCLIAKDAAGNILDKNGNKSRSDNRKRDGLYGRTWVYYTERQWHNIVPKKTTSYNNKKEFEMIFDIAKYPKGTCFSVVAFYYPDYYNHPSIYSTSNVINVNKTNVDMNVKITSPAHNTTSPTANPTIKVRVTKGNVAGFSYNSIYENYNLATGYDYAFWATNPVWIRVPRNKDMQVPNFTKGTCYKTNHPYKDTYLTEPAHAIEYYNSNKSIYTSANLFRIAGASINDEGSFKENALFLRANDNNQVHLGDIETYTLLEQGYIDFTWTQNTGRFLSIGENRIEAFTSPYIYDNDVIDYGEHQSYWISDTTLYSMPIMPYNPFRDSIIKPANKTWAEVEGDILTVKIPYGLFQPNKTYSFKFSRYVDTGFFYEGSSTITNPDVSSLCSSHMYLSVAGTNLTGLKYTHDNLIYSPAYTLVSSSTTNVKEVNNYDKWITNEVTFTTPSESTLIQLDKDNKFISIDIKVRGICIIKMKDFTLKSTDGTHVIDANKGRIDVSVRENKTFINLLYQGSINIDFDYINPLNYKDMMDLRDYLNAIAIIYGVDVKPGWRTLVKDQSYLMACDFNDTKNHCINLFTTIKNKYPTTFTGDVSLFNNLPTLKPGHTSTMSPSSKLNRGKHYFPEWDDLLDIIKKQIK